MQYNIWWRLKTFSKPQNQICTKGGFTLALFVDEQTLIFDVVDLDLELVAHINSGSYREEANTGKVETQSTWHRCNAHTSMME